MLLFVFNSYLFEGIILIRNRHGINSPVPCGDAFDAGRSVFEIAQSGDEMVFEGVDAVEDPVVEVLLAQFVPEMLLRVEFG